MSLYINSNIEAFNAHRNLAATSIALSKSMQRLSTGLRINSAADDAAGLGISERLRAQISGAAQATRNAQDGISLVQTAEGSLQEISSILQRVRDLALQYSNGTYSSADKAAITAEATQLNAEVTRQIAAAQFNGVALLGASAMLGTLQVGTNGTANDQIGIAGFNATTAIGTAVSGLAGGNPNLTNIDAAISAIAAGRGTFGAVQNRLEHTINSLGSYQENLMGAESRIRDVDMALEMTNLTRLQVLQQSGTAMLAQANLAPGGLLKLLGG